MNSLSWLLYFGDVVGSVNAVISILVLLTILSGIGLLMFAIIETPWCEEQKKEHFKTVKGWASTWLKVVGVVYFVGVLFPSKQTVYMIAASELGEEVITSETGKKLVKKLNQELDKLIEEE